jgi:hypothetical protein
VVHLAPE